ncbi:MAG: PAS domain-containing protein [Desulfobacterales bacterium]|nr:MAG: PAS domain-containing protein [Desulfobacterales bacterium]
MMRHKLNFGLLLIFLMLWGVCIYMVLSHRSALKAFIEFERDTVPDAVAMIELEKGTFEIAHYVMEYIAHGKEGDMKNAQAGVSNLIKIGEEHLRREQPKGPNKEKGAAELLGKIKRLNVSVTQLISLKKNGVGAEELFRVEEKIHPVFDSLIAHAQTYRNIHMKTMASVGTRVFNKHNDIIKKSKLLGIAGTFLALTIVLFTDRRVRQLLNDRYQEERRLKKGRDDLSTALNSTGQAVIFTNSTGQVYGMNPEAERLVNIEMDEKEPPVLSDMLTIVNPSTKEPLEDPVARLLKEGAITEPDDTFILMTKNGGDHPVVFNGSAIIGDDGTAQGTVLTFRDITDDYHQLQMLNEDEARLRLVVFSTYQLIYDWDFKTNEFKWFGDIDNVLGYRPSTFVKWEQSLHPNDRNEVIEAYQKVLFEKTSTFDMKYRIKREDGTWRTWIDRGGVMLDETNEPYKWVGACTDITEYKWTEKTLREKQYYFRSLIDNLHEDVLVIGSDYRITFVNDRLLEKTGLKREDVIGNHCSKVLYDYDDPCMKHGKACKLQEVFDTGKPGRCSHEMTRKDGSVVWKDILFSPLKDAGGKVTRVIETIRDVTDLLASDKNV